MSGVNCVGYCTLSATDTGGATLGESSTAGIPSRARGCTITVEQAGVRLRMDGTASDTGIGNGDLLNIGDVVVLDSWTVPSVNWKSVMLGMRFASDVTGSTGELSIHYFD